MTETQMLNTKVRCALHFNCDESAEASQFMAPNGAFGVRLPTGWEIRTMPGEWLTVFFYCPKCIAKRGDGE